MFGGEKHKLRRTGMQARASRPVAKFGLGLSLVVVLSANAPAGGQQQSGVLPSGGVLDPAKLELADLSPGFLGLYRKVMQIEHLIREQTDRYDLDYDRARAVCLYESGGNAGLTSWAGAEGYY